MITKIGRDTESDKYRLDTSSLIDVSFLLLIYFLVTSTLDPREGDLAMTIPTEEKGTKQIVQEISVDHPEIEVDAAGNILFGGEVVDTDPSNHNLVVLEDRLKTYVEMCRVVADVEFARVNLEVDDSVPGQRLIDVMNCLAKTGIQKVIFDDSWKSGK